MPGTRSRASLALGALLVAAALARTEGEPSEGAAKRVDVLKASELNKFGVPAVVYPDVFTPEQCNDFIEEAERGDWDRTPDSIDNYTMYQIDIWNKNHVIHEQLYALLAPHISKIKSWMKARFPSFKNSMDWVFMRKYAKDCERQGLKAHYDSNEHSLNVALSTDFEDGDLFFVRQDSDIGKMGLRGELLSSDPSVDYANVPRGGGGNNTRYFYPFLRPGHGLVHDKTLWHGITKVTRGVKYSLLFFFDEPERDMSSQVSVYFNNVRVSNRSVDIFWQAENGVLKAVHSGLGPGEKLLQISFPNHVFVARDSASGDVVGTYSVNAEAGGDELISITDDSKGDGKKAEEEEEEEEEEEGEEEKKEREEITTEAALHPATTSSEDTSITEEAGEEGEKKKDVKEDNNADTKITDDDLEMPEKIELWGYDVRPFLEDDEGRPRLEVIGGLAVVSLAVSMTIILVFLPKLEEHERQQAEGRNERVEARQDKKTDAPPQLAAENNELPSLEKPPTAKKND